MGQTRFSAGATITDADIDRIENLRLEIQRLYAQHDYANAEPVYRRYVAAIERVAPTDTRLAMALQNYGELLRKLHKDTEAAAAEARASAILSSGEGAVLPYALKDWRLGMTLDDFTKLAPPGDPAKIKNVCSCDAGQEVEVLNDEDKSAKIIQCGYWQKGLKDVVGDPFKISVAHIDCSPDFRFVEDGGAYRLFEINVPFFSSDYQAMKRALIEKYGDPKLTKVTKVKTEMGNIFPLTDLIWDNGVSRIKLTNADGSNLGRAKLRYIHRQLYLAYANRINAQRESPTRQAAEDL
jgi:hypothetical protein